MEFSSPPEVEEFRAELRGWLDANLDDRFRGLRFDLEGGAEWLALMHEWNGRLADAGYAAISWPVEYGGRGAGLLEQVALTEELSRADAPGPLNVVGISNIAPAILQFGTEAQKRRFLTPMLRGDEIWCQGFSEPDAGSDLASLSTRAERDGDDYIVNGQKVWNTLGHLAGWCELLVRTDHDAPKHKGISCLLVDMSLAGIEVRPLVTITGEREFSEIFFHDVRIPADALLGEANAGWMVAMTTLANERGGVANLHLVVRKKIARLVELARETSPAGHPVSADPLIRQRLADLHTRGETLRLLADRAISLAISGQGPGPEGSLAKLVWSQLDQDCADVAGAILGPAAAMGDWARESLASRALSIAGGTTEVNKNILAERVLGLPR